MAQSKLIDDVKEDPNKLVIPYKAFQLNNGLTVLIHEDHSDPIVHVDVTYHVGSAREEIGKSGFAHFFEHMMFQGSDNVGDEQHFKIITEAGGTLNGTTNRDRTNYFETVPSNQLEKMLWLEADRMGFLLDAVTQKKFEVQRATVKNERGQRYDNRPYGLAGEVVAKNLYPYGHPYSWLTIGYIEDLNRVNVNDLKNFFLRWYGPNNAVLTVGGDVNTAEVLTMVEKYFGSIPKRPDVSPMPPVIPHLENDRYVSYVDNYAKQPLLRMVFPTPQRFSKDEAALDCVAEILGGGKSSILYKNFIKEKIAMSANASNPASELAGEFSITILPYPGQKLSDMVELVRKSIKEFETRGVTDEDLLKFKNQREAQLVYRMETVAGKVSTLASYFTFLGNANYINDDLENARALTKEDVMNAFEKYIKNKPAVILSVLTKEDESNTAGKDNFTVSKAGYKAPDYNYEGLVYNKAKDNFDRSVMPPSGPNPVVNIPEIWKFSSSENIRMIGTANDEMPATVISISMPGGKLDEIHYPGKEGLANFLANMLNEETTEHSAQEFEDELNKIGSSIHVFPGLDRFTVQARSLNKNLGATMTLLEERITKSVLSQESFDLIKKRILNQIKNNANQPSSVASKVYDHLLYGNSPYGTPWLGTEQSIENITLEDVRSFYKRTFHNNKADIVTVGILDKKRAPFTFKYLNELPEYEPAAYPKATPNTLDKSKVYVVDFPGAAQTEFRIGATTGLRYDVNGDYYKSTVMNYPLGGAFNSRLNLELRENKGWTYGARSGFSSDEFQGDFTFSSGIKASATDSALAVVLNKIENFRKQGATPEELAFTKSSIGQSDARKYETGFQKASFLYRILKYNLADDYPVVQSHTLKNLSVKEVNQLAKKYLPSSDDQVILLVGDKDKIVPGLKSMGKTIIELDKNGNPKK